jgi:hypothetical protein
MLGRISLWPYKSILQEKLCSFAEACAIAKAIGGARSAKALW